MRSRPRFWSGHLRAVARWRAGAPGAGIASQRDLISNAITDRASSVAGVGDGEAQLAALDGSARFSRVEVARALEPSTPTSAGTDRHPSTKGSVPLEDLGLDVLPPKAYLVAASVAGRPAAKSVSSTLDRRFAERIAA